MKAHHMCIKSLVQRMCIGTNACNAREVKLDVFLGQAINSVFIMNSESSFGSPCEIRGKIIDAASWLSLARTRDGCLLAHLALHHGASWLGIANVVDLGVLWLHCDGTVVLSVWY